jgi:hypothetical protein
VQSPAPRPRRPKPEDTPSTALWAELLEDDRPSSNAAADDPSIETTAMFAAFREEDEERRVEEALRRAALAQAAQAALEARRQEPATDRAEPGSFAPRLRSLVRDVFRFVIGD